MGFRISAVCNCAGACAGHGELLEMRDFGVPGQRDHPETRNLIGS